MSNIKAVLEFLKILVEIYRWVGGEITDHIFQSRIVKIKTALLKAQTGTPEQRTDGGSDVEDNFNRHT